MTSSLHSPADVCPHIDQLGGRVQHQLQKKRTHGNEIMGMEDESTQESHFLKFKHY